MRSSQHYACYRALQWAVFKMHFGFLGRMCLAAAPLLLAGCAQQQTQSHSSSEMSSVPSNALEATVGAVGTEPLRYRFSLAQAEKTIDHVLSTCGKSN